MKKRKISSIKFLSKLSCSALLLTAPLFSFAQALSQPEAQTRIIPNVQSIKIEFVELRNVSESYIRSHIKIEEGLPYDQVKMDQSIKGLYKTGKFELIQTKTQATTDGKVDVIITVQPKYRLSVVKLICEDSDMTSDLLDEVKIKTGDLLDEAKIKEDLELLKAYLIKKYYPFSQITYSIEKNDNTGEASLVFKVDTGKKLRINAVSFTGNNHVESGQLKDQIKTETWWALTSWVTGAGRFDENVFRDDLRKIKDFYSEQGFLDVSIPQEEIQFDFSVENRIGIALHINEGVQYHIGKISVEGNVLFSESELLVTANLKQGEIFAPSKITAANQALMDYYGSRGYLNRRVYIDRRPNLQTHDIDLIFKVTEGKKAYVESIRIDGNTKTKNIVILRELALSPGDTFDTVRMRNSENRLKNTRFFTDMSGMPKVSLTPEPTNIPDRYNLHIQVEEGRTGNLSFGAGFSSLEQLVFYVEMTQGNFDISNPSSYFQGDGQKFHTRLQLGTKSTQALISFEEPWIWERQLSGGIDLFFTESKYNSDTYNETRLGFELFLRKRLIELIEGRLYYRLENVGILDVESGAPTPIKSEEGYRLVSKVGLALTRDTRDSYYYPTRGNRIQLINELAGTIFGGETDYYKVEFRGAQYFKMPWGAEQVFSVTGKMGTITPINDDYVPFFDRYTLGGPNWMRGFDYREVGPNENDEPIGGNSMATFSLEYSVLLFEPIRFAVFYDWGFVNESDFNFSTSGYNDDWGIGIRMLIMGAPLRLDLAFPITSEEYNKQSSQFYFSFGSQF